MSKKGMYGRLVFILFTFTLLAFVLAYEFGGTLAENIEVIDKNNVGKEVVTIGEDIDSEELDEPDNNTDSKEGEEIIPDTSLESEIDKEIVMVFAGDIYLSDYVLNAYKTKGIDGILSKELQEEFNHADIAMANQEFAFSNRGTPMANKQYTFRVDPIYTNVFTDMGLDIVTLANNHSLDFGVDALVDSLDSLSEKNIKYVGAGRNSKEARETKYIEVNDKTIAILAASRVIPDTAWNAASNTPGLLTTYDPTALIEEIKLAKEQSDYIVVYVHWGIEKENYPKEYQRVLGKQYIDAGADIVIGSHPHVLQGIEYYNNKPIVYSLGNFMFYNTIKQTAVLKVILDEDNQAKLSLLPSMATNGETQLLDKTKYDDFYDFMKEISFDVDFIDGIVVPR